MENIDMYTVNKSLEEYTKNFEWFNRNYDMLKKNYPNKIVAVDQERVIHDSTNLKDVEKITSKMPSAYIGAVIAEDLLWIL
jgi:hypothetical protein